MAVIGGEADHQRRDIFGQGMGVDRVVGRQHLGDAGHGGGGLGGGAAALAGDQDRHRTELGPRGDGVEGGRRQRGVAVIGNDEYGHQITFASLRNRRTSSGMPSTTTPASRFGGSSTFRVTSRGATSTPRSAGVKVSMVFFFAFMILGSEA